MLQNHAFLIKGGTCISSIFAFCLSQCEGLAEDYILSHRNKEGNRFVFRQSSNHYCCSTRSERFIGLQDVSRLGVSPLCQFATLSVRTTMQFATTLIPGTFRYPYYYFCGGGPIFFGSFK